MEPKSLLFLIFPFLVGSACAPKATVPGAEHHAQFANTDKNKAAMSDKIMIKADDHTFTATLLDNATASAFKDMLPLTISMTELNGNEKFFRLSKNLPADASNPGTIHAGDLMLWGANTLVLFYKTFSTSYSYTKLGRVDAPAGLATALGSGNVTVTLNDTDL